MYSIYYIIYVGYVSFESHAQHGYHFQTVAMLKISSPSKGVSGNTGKCLMRYRMLNFNKREFKETKNIKGRPKHIQSEVGNVLCGNRIQNTRIEKMLVRFRISRYIVFPIYYCSHPPLCCQCKRPNIASGSTYKILQYLTSRHSEWKLTTWRVEWDSIDSLGG